MSFKVDVDKSTKARTDGNTSFKKGRWTEAIGHYTTAIVFNPEDGLGYTNRAAAYLKIDKWRDAERDCTTALSLARGQPSVKALYRRSLARKALEDIDGAIKDIEAVLEVEPTNETALEEKVELEDLRRKATSKRDSQSQKTKTLPPSPPRPPVTLPTTTTETELPSGKDARMSDLVISETDSEPAGITVEQPASVARNSFADLKKGRQAGRKAFATPPAPAPIPSTPSPSHPDVSDHTAPPSSPPSLSGSTPAPADITSPTIKSTPSSSKVEPVTQPIPLLNPLAPGSALALITTIRRYPPQTTLPLISHLSIDPAAIGRMLDNFLEPDQLTLILKRLNETLDQDQDQSDPGVVRRFMVGMTQTKRWAMTAIMLSKTERALGQEVWSKAGGQGDFARRQDL